MDQPPGLLAEDELEALQVELPGGVAGEVPRCLLPGLLLLARYLALCLAEVVILVDVDFDVALKLLMSAYERTWLLLCCFSSIYNYSPRCGGHFGSI